MNCSEYLVDFLIKKGVTDVFGYSGGYIVPFMDALYARRDEIKVHVCYNEQGCAYAADGFARTSGKLGVYFTTSGPGAVNGFVDWQMHGLMGFRLCVSVVMFQLMSKEVSLVFVKTVFKKWTLSL